MTSTPGYRDIGSWNEATAPDADRGRRYVAVIGIDRYRTWGRLYNAVQDAQGARDAFVKLGFEPFGPQLFDGAATREAIHRLVTHDLRKLGQHDSLVLFFAGHGYTVTTPFEDGKRATCGYLIPVDADKVDAGISTWMRVDHWLRDICVLPPKHILVVLDACHSGIAVDAFRYRGEPTESLAALRARRSRRIITSALANELALDGGPIAGHSIFTGCFLETLANGTGDRAGQSVLTGSDLGIHVRHRVSEWTKSRQTPDFGTLEFDDRGELVIELPGARELPTSEHDRFATTAQASSEANEQKPRNPLAAPVVRPQTSPRPRRVATEPKAPRRTSASHDVAHHGETTTPRENDPTLNAAFTAALDRQDAERKWGGGVLSIVTGDATVAPAGWATWAAGRGYLTLVTEATGIEASITDLLAQTQWLRSLPAARARLAAAAQIDVKEVDAVIDARSDKERAAWIDDIAGIDQHARVSGWLLSALREPRTRVLDLATAPMRGSALLATLWDLAAPIAVLVHHPEPTTAWLERAIPTAAALVTYLPRHPVAVGAPSELVRRVLSADRDSTALSMARQGLVDLAPLAGRPPDRARDRAEQRLHDALVRDRRTAGQFERNVQVPVHECERTIEVDLVARRAHLAVQIDRWYHLRDPQSYRRERVKDVWLSRAGFFVMRFLAEEVEQRLELIVIEIAVGLASRRASESFLENHL